MSDKPLISVIVPVYNVERYLPRCIESILGQTYTNFELILVDDGTPDRSGVICDRYAEKDARIKVIHKENGGVSSARNAGIDAAQGEWITFIDSDDWVSDEYLAVLTCPVIEYKYDLTAGLLEYRSITTKYKSSIRSEINVDEINTNGMLEAIDRMEFIVPFVKLFSKKVILENNLRFLEGVARGEDAIFVKSYMKYCNKIHIEDKVIYHYNKLNAVSVTVQNQQNDKRKIWDFQILKNYYEMLDAWGVNRETIENIITKKAVSLFLINARSYITALAEQETKNQIVDMIAYYNRWIYIECDWLSNPENAEYRKIADCINKKQIDDIYSAVYQKNIFSRKRLRNFAKKLLRPFIEKYRDGLVKFKF